MSYFLVNGGMTISVALFLAGYFYRKQNNRMHRILMTAGILFNLISAAILLVSVHLVFGSDMSRAGFFPSAPAWVILVHRIFALFVLFLMFAQGWTGIKRHRAAHILIHRFFLPSYLLTYVSGLIVFSSHPV